jgi:hypothetical protein
MKIKIAIAATILLSTCICSFGQYAAIEGDNEFKSTLIKPTSNSMENVSMAQTRDLEAGTVDYASINIEKENADIIPVHGDGFNVPVISIPHNYEVPELVFDPYLYVEEWMKVPFLSVQLSQYQEL